jgi:hypothetical protein
MSDKAGTKTLHRPKAKNMPNPNSLGPAGETHGMYLSQEGRRGKKKKKKKGEEWGDLLARGCATMPVVESASSVWHPNW